MDGGAAARGGLMLTISTASREYVRAKVSAKASGTVVNPTGDTVEIAFLATEDAPSSGDWKTASWDTDTTTDPDTYYAQCLVGTGGAVVLTAGVYNMYVRITDSPEVPVKRSGIVKVV
jgi:hypothetical protein